jgi:hypothetical protein
MRLKTKKIIAAVAVIGAVAVGGAAYTAANIVPDTVAGYGTSTITGATATSIVYTLNGPGTQITGVALTFTGDLTADTVQAGFGTDSLTTCVVGAFATPNTPVTCTFTQPTATAGTFNVAVTNTL